MNGKARTMELGSYRDIGLSAARNLAQKYRAEAADGHDPKLTKAQRKALAQKSIDDEARTVKWLCDEYYRLRVLKRKPAIKHPEIIRRRLENHIIPVIGKIPLKDLEVSHARQVLNKANARGTPTVANDVLRTCKQVFNWAAGEQWMPTNIFAHYSTQQDAGGRESPRDRFLDEDELRGLFGVMKTVTGWSAENDATIKLLLMLCVRKMELIGARVSEFNLDAGMWTLPGDRTKTGKPIDIPLPRQAAVLVERLVSLSCGSEYLLPARKQQTRMLPHISPDTVNSATGRFIKPEMTNPDWTIHDLRRTSRTALSRLKVDAVVAEKCLNHVSSKIIQTYDQHAFYEERQEALSRLADYYESLGMEV
jgi:integrase